MPRKLTARAIKAKNLQELRWALCGSLAGELLFGAASHDWELTQKMLKRYMDRIDEENRQDAPRDYVRRTN
jgi:hypothetical protein